jgi:hypothetical protein
MQSRCYEPFGINQQSQSWHGLTIYALALSRLTGIPLYHFKCAWFDDEHYFDFYLRAVVQKRGGRGR